MHTIASPASASGKAISAPSALGHTGFIPYRMVILCGGCGTKKNELLLVKNGGVHLSIAHPVSVELLAGVLAAAIASWRFW